MESISVARALLCTGPYQQYPVPICYGLRLLRVLDALTICFHKFPIEVLKLVRLRYLALTYSAQVPGSISKLWNLEYLIVHRHLIINKFSGDSSHLPVEIWNMRALRHLQVTGSNLPVPCRRVNHRLSCPPTDSTYDASRLPDLLTLSDMSVNSCSKKILERTPNLKKLGIQNELSVDAVETLCCFDHLSLLRHPESFKCVVVNPKPRSQVFASITTFPSNLMKLSLSGLGDPWEYITTMAKMPNLKVLKLRFYSFQGPVWETNQVEFQKLRYLLIEDTDLVHWRSNGNFCFPILRCLIIRHCYKLKEIRSSSLGRITNPKLMKLVDCPSFGASAEQLRERDKFSNINFHSSLDDEN